MRVARRFAIAGLAAGCILWAATTSGFGEFTRANLVPWIQETWETPSQRAYDIHNIVRKCLHVPAYALLACTLAWALRGTRRWALLALAGALAIAMIDELIQGTTPGRQASARDICLDMLGAFIGITLIKLCARFTRLRKST